MTHKVKFKLSDEEFEDQTTQFINAVEQNDLLTVKQYLDEGVNPNIRNIHSMTVLHISVENGYINLLQILLENANTNINAFNDFGQTPLHLACMYCNLDIVGKLLQKGANINISDKNGYSPLHNAVIWNCMKVVEMLLEYKAKVDVENVFGKTPLYMAVVDCPSIEIAKLLIKHGARVNKISKKIMPLLLECALTCFSYPQLKMVELLLKNGAYVDSRDRQTYRTALHIVAITGYLPLAKLLLKRGANAHLMDYKNDKPYHVALRHQNYEIAKLLSK